ncbi:MAG: glutamine--fructose-6-phosphate transaminase (isomerizing) [Acidobacteriota bacterium]|nr:glutamine--fructose-6-phosphate transaminase (isomerizing) [Acidobacteriota bacterium]
MCGIVAYAGKQNACAILLEGLKRLEYRGYDSSGIAVLGKTPFLAKAVGKVASLEERIKDAHPEGTVGIAHTRWATHGKPTEANAHPHTDCTGNLFLVHNGIIENYLPLKKQLAAAGHAFHTETDTEVLAHLIESLYQGDLETAVLRALQSVEGTYGLAIIHARHPRQIIVARRGSPIVLGAGDGESLAASDASALAQHTDEVVYLEDNEVARVEPGRFWIKTLDNRAVSRPAQALEGASATADRGNFPHFMLKEIFEQPEAVENALRGRLNHSEGVAKLGGLESVMGRLEKARHLIIVSCGTSYYAGLYARYVFETLTDLTVETELASEFRYRKLNIRENTVVLAISQSGETADTLAALREAKRKGALVLGLVNVVGSTIARETDAGVYSHAGMEIGVASTKSFTSQMTILVLIALLLGRSRDLSYEEGERLLRGLERIPGQIRSILEKAEGIRELAQNYCAASHFLFIGRKYQYPVALEGALKLKEVSYIHAEGYAAGEMKHGPIALIDASFPTMALAPDDSSHPKIISNIQEIRARGGPVIAITTEGNSHIRSFADHVIEVPANDSILMPLLTVVPLQLFAYHCALLRGCDVDKPRNLAKSVTVE